MTLLRALAVFCAVLFSWTVQAATLLPNGQQQFFDNVGKPLNGGLVYFYIPNTNNFKNTYQDSGSAIVNSNPVVLDSAGRAIIYGTGTYRQRVTDSLGNLIYDQITADGSSAQLSYAGTTTGTANAQAITAANFTSADGQIIVVKSSISNTGPMTINVNSTGPLSVLKDVAAGTINLTGSEFTAGGEFIFIYDAALGAFHLTNDKFSTIATASTLGLVKVGSNIAAAVDGTISITQSVFTGEIRSFAINTCPSGWVEANGGTVSRTSTLGIALGSAWGAGDGTTTYNLPDARGYALRGWDHGRGIDSGRAFATSQADAFQDHSHLYDFTLNATAPGPAQTPVGAGGGTGQYQTRLASASGAFATSNETRMKNIAVLFCIKN